MATCPECRESIKYGASKCPNCLSSITESFEEEQERESRSKAHSSYRNASEDYKDAIDFEEHVDMTKEGEDEDAFDNPNDDGYFSDLTDDEENY